MDTLYNESLPSSLRVLAINPGSTSTKIAVNEDGKELLRVSVEHRAAELSQFKNISDQYDLRRNAILGALEKAGIETKSLAAVVARGGFLPPVLSGAYFVNDAMVQRLATSPAVEHAANLGAPIALSIARPLGIDAFIYDSVAVDELDDIARISGCAEITRRSLSHALNMRATALRCAADLGKSYYQSNFIVAHLGGGITLSLHKAGHMVDLVSDDEGPFSPERAGSVPIKDLIRLCYSKKEAEVRHLLRGGGGLVSYLGTNSALEAENRLEAGDKKAALVFEAMAYQVAKSIGELATVVSGKLDAVVLTGGIAHSKRFTGWITERVAFIAPVKVYPGENELEALAQGALRVLKKEEVAHEYVEPILS
ncbi:butyrate kinase [Treponema sp.]